MAVTMVCNMCSNTPRYLLKAFFFNAVLLGGATCILLGGYYFKTMTFMIIGWVLILLDIIFMLFCMDYQIPDDNDSEQYEADVTIIL